jgi:2-polyprenyl-3-methyl-5-hydroxy-6-metoxy-1,4-benzoquinol methylase
MNLDLIEHNRRAWNQLSEGGIRWGEPVDPSVLARARNGDWDVALAGEEPVPHAWFGNAGQIAGTRVLCLASGGGQQAPILAAAGADVTSLDLSDVQLAKDRQVAEQNGLALKCQQGSMTDLSRFHNASFDTVFLPVAIGYIADVHVVWRECARVLRPSGRLLVGMINPLVSLFDENEGEAGVGLQVVNTLPYAEVDALAPAERDAALARGMAFSWSHTLTDLIGGQLGAGLQLLALAEARRSDSRAPNINRFTTTYIMTAAERA